MFRAHNWYYGPCPPGGRCPQERVTLLALNGHCPRGIAPLRVPSEHWAGPSTPGSTNCPLPSFSYVIHSLVTNAEKQKAYRARQGWAGRRKDRDRKRAAREKPVSVTSVTLAPVVRYEKREVREVQETRYVDMDDVEGDEQVMRRHKNRWPSGLEKRPPGYPVDRWNQT